MADKILNICQSKLKESESTFVWMIHNFSDRRLNATEFLESGIFSSTSPSSGNPVKWSLRLTCPNPNAEYDFLFISINPVDATNISAKIKFMIRNSEGVDVEKLTIPNRIFTKGQYYQPNSALMKRAELFGVDKGFLLGDRLQIVFQVTIFEPTVEMECGILDDLQIPEHDMGHLFEQGLFTDCILVAADGVKFEAHKGILACQSPVFRAMFENEMIEAKEGIVKIKDIKSPVLEQMLKFMYSGKAPKLAEMTMELLEAADKYELDTLKKLCTREFATSLGNENVCELLVLTDQYSAKYLKKYAIKYLQMNANEVMETSGWKMLIEGNNHTELISQIFKTTFE